MKVLGAKLIPVTRGQATLKEAVDEAFEEYLKDPESILYAIGSVVGPYPWPVSSRVFNVI
jgi:tryptophan synthase beta chain